MIKSHLKQVKQVILLSCVSLLILGMQSKWHGYHLHKNGTLKSHTNITGFSLVLIHPAHQQYFGTSDPEKIRLLLNDTLYDVQANRPDTLIPKNRKFNLLQNSSYYSTTSDKDKTANQIIWNANVLKPDRYYLIRLPETRRYNKRPIIYFNLNTKGGINTIIRTWSYLKLSS